LISKSRITITQMRRNSQINRSKYLKNLASMNAGYFRLDKDRGIYCF
jgi:hypothetical protein